MKNLKYIALATIIGVGALTATTFADDSNMNSDSMDSMKGRPMMIHNHGSMSGAQMGSGMEMKKLGQVMFEKYLKSDLTDTDKAAIETIKSNHEAAMKALMESVKLEKSNIGQADMQTKMTEMQTKMKALHDQFVSDLIPYIANDKVDEFKTAMAKMPVMVGGAMNGKKNGMDNGNQNGKDKKENKGQNNGNGQKAQTAGQILPTSVAKALDTRLATFSTDADKITWLTGVNTKIDTLLTKSLSVKNKNLLNALKELITERIDTLSGTSFDTNSILDILQ